MSGLKDFAKKGWHPKNETQGFRNTLRHGIGGGGGGGDEKPDYSTYSAAPLSTLKDPASFGPPPKHVSIYGSEAGPGGNASTAARQTTSPPPAAASPSLPSRPQAAASPAPPARPPARQEPTPIAAPAPKLPPRLPPRQNSHPDLHSPAPPPTYDQAVEGGQSAATGYINTQAADRLGRAGVSVPGFGIGGQGKPQSPPPRQPATSAHLGQMSELQARFARTGKGDAPETSSPSHSAAPAQSSTQQYGGVAQGIQSGVGAAASAAAAKKAKPPPPRKKPELSAAAAGDQSAGDAPPPIPLSSKPR